MSEEERGWNWLREGYVSELDELAEEGEDDDYGDDGEKAGDIIKNEDKMGVLSLSELYI